ncbi:ancient conserved domain protein-related [Anaeramoeba ignava]|uniref:Ancient conserved domain protein-related n=1 Tax=Anaeramoeba ignava TaxID=1746090 RepID=A0A9Q0RGI1_ANAIG|nr:ancient conserved domain protein-related [Anaeramoeba ignava]
MQITKIQLFLFLLFLTLIIVDTKKDQHNTERNKKTYGEGEKLIAEVQHHISPGTGKFYLYLIICISLVLIAGLMSGLTIGLLSLNLRELEILKSVGDPNERKYAAKIIPLVRNHHWLLVTLLLCNSAAMEALPIFLDQLVNEILAIVLSTTAILFFGEIFPQALCSRYSLAIGARVAWPVRILTWITAPLSWTIGKLLDFILGHSSPPLYARYQLKELVSMHGTK